MRARRAPASICYVTDRRAISGADRDRERHLLALVSAAARGGVDFVQVRERDLDAAALRRLVRACLEAVAGTSCRILVNDRIDVAVATEAAGVHLRGDSVPTRRARDLLGPARIVGRSIHSVEEAYDADTDGGADYLLFGTLFHSTSKPADVSPAGVHMLARTVASTDLPVLAIGGITLDTVAAVAAAGAAGFAGVGFFQAYDPEELAGRISAARQQFDTLRQAP
jgi:thiamine-phosphate pyrophosphorylase